MNCVKCNTPIPEEKSFCPNCGHLKDAAKSSNDKSLIRPANERNYITPVASLIGALLLSTVVVLFARQNASPVAASFFSSYFEASLAVIIVGVFVLGAFAGVLAGIFVSSLRS